MWLTGRNSLFVILFSFSKAAFSQLVVDTTRTPAQLVQNVMLGGNLVAYNIKYTGANRAIAYFNGSYSNIGLNYGILMTSGSAKNAIGPNNPADRGVRNNLPGDTALTRICGDSTYDASILEFDFVPYADTVSFNFVFGSEEYPQFTCCKVNDVFAFFISGPGISGTRNIALVPNTAIPISINTLNGDCTKLSDCGGGCCNSNSEYYIDNSGGSSIQYTGFTKVMKALSPVECGRAYHIRIAIADGGDGYYDSGVFLGGGSFVGGTNAEHITYSPSDSICPNDPVTISFPDNDPTHIFKWSFNGANVALGSGSGPYTVSWQTSGEKQVRVSVSGPCAYNLDSAFIYVGTCDIKVPNIFTPGSGDINARFYIFNLDKYPNTNLTVYDRWGETVYSSPNYKNNWNGGNLPEGTYYYILTLANGETKQGFVMILRK